jgi:hypothetical protein
MIHARTAIEPAESSIRSTGITDDRQTQFTFIGKS